MRVRELAVLVISKASKNQRLSGRMGQEPEVINDVIWICLIFY
jgi:hypothetical protein